MTRPKKDLRLFSGRITLDAVLSQFCSGELEATVIEAFEGEDPDVIVIEGQGALSHPAYSTSAFIQGGIEHGVWQV